MIALIKSVYENFDIEIIDKENNKFIFKTKLLKVSTSQEEILFEGEYSYLHHEIWSNYPYPIKFDMQKLIIGCDETGVGDYFGSLIGVATILYKEQINYIKKFNIVDSKLVNDEWIWTNIPLLLVIMNIEQNAVKIITPSIYNKLIEKKINSHEIKTFLHTLTISKLIEKNPQLKNLEIVIDAYCNLEQWKKYSLNLKEKKLIQVSLVPDKLFFKAESKYLEVAIASNIARYYFLLEWKKIEKWLGIGLPKGATDTNAIYKAAKKIYEVKGLEGLKSVCKWHFKTTRLLDFIKN